MIRRYDIAYLFVRIDVKIFPLTFVSTIFPESIDSFYRPATKNGVDINIAFQSIAYGFFVVDASLIKRFVAGYV
uniref:hypothetical protein n=1 Tax=Flavobacterium microcysteis TaxID=2596891 RepID=UPI0037432EB8